MVSATVMGKIKWMRYYQEDYAISGDKRLSYAAYSSNAESVSTITISLDDVPKGPPP